MHKINEAAPYDAGLEYFRRSLSGVVRSAVLRERRALTKAKEPKIRPIAAPASFGALENAGSLMERLRRECEAAGGQSKWAALHGLSRSAVSAALNGGALIPSIASALGFRPCVLYEPVKRTHS